MRNRDRHFNASHLGKRIFLVVVFFYLGIFGYHSLKHLRQFSFDSMNYVDVAKNISSGRGIQQSSLGFNQKHFSIKDNIPTPFVSQPPLYPLTIAVISLFGIRHSDGALLVSVVCYALLLGIVYLMSKSLFDEYVALLSVSLLLVYYPLRLVGRYACSEPLGLVLVFGSFLVLVHAAQFLIQYKKNGWIWMSGLLAGLAFSCRYVLLPTFLVGIAFILLTFKDQTKKNMLIYTLGFAFPFLAVIGHNFFVSGSIMTAPNPSETGLRKNLADAFWSLFGNYVHQFDPKIEAALFFLCILFVAVLFVVRKRFFHEIGSILFPVRRSILILWMGFYLAFIILQRMRFHFDPITPRFMVFVGVPLIVVLCALLSASIRLKPWQVIPVAVLFSLFAFGKELIAAIRTPDYDLQKVIQSSERLCWVCDNTTQEDLIFGDNTVDIVFYLNRPAVVSFSPYPYTDYIDYDRITGYIQNHGDQYDRFFLVLRKRFRQVDRVEKSYGPFVFDLILKKTGSYPGLIFIKELEDGFVYEIQTVQK